MRAVLLGMANPNELSQRQLPFVAFLLERWAEKAELQRGAIADEVDLPPLVIDLESSVCPERGRDPGAAPRYVDVKRLAKSLRNRIGLLRKGESPAKLALGEDCVQPSCEQLLVFLYRQWCQARPPRDPERVRSSDAAQCCTEIPAIHYYVSGRVFRQPEGGEAKELTAKQRAEIEAFGRLRTSDEDDYSVVHGFLIEQWKIEDESAQGLRMLRAAASEGHRHSHGRLLAVKPGDSKSFILGQIRWLMQNDAGDLYAGVRLLPGLLAASAVRATALNAPPTLVLPSAWYKPKRVIEVHVEGQGAVRVRLTDVLDRGADYERCAYEVVT
jgi:hypothetical protein